MIADRSVQASISFSPDPSEKKAAQECLIQLPFADCLQEPAPADTLLRDRLEEYALQMLESSRLSGMDNPVGLCSTALLASDTGVEEKGLAAHVINGDG
jgi:hypothetical protein